MNKTSEKEATIQERMGYMHKPRIYILTKLLDRHYQKYAHGIIIIVHESVGMTFTRTNYFLLLNHAT